VSGRPLRRDWTANVEGAAERERLLREAWTARAQAETARARAELARAETEAALLQVEEARAMADAARARQEFLSVTGRTMAASLDYRRTLEQVAQAAVPVLADWCSVTMLRDDGRLETLALAHIDAAMREEAWRLVRRYPPRADASAGVAHVIRTGEMELVPAFDAATFDPTLPDDDEQMLALLRLAPHAALTVPLKTPTRTIGAITFLLTDPARTFAPEDVAVARSLAARAGLHVQNARLYTERSRIAQTLQRSLLPSRLPSIPGLELAARYRAAGEQNEVGGDFYDAFSNGDGLWSAFIGDVSGKGAGAAALTSLARHTLYASALRSDDAVENLRLVNDAMRARGDESRFCTLVHLHVRPGDGEALVTVTNAGHLQPLVVRRDGAVEEVRAAGTLLGVVPRPTFQQREVRLRAGELVLLYTDGVVELRGREPGFGARQLHETLRSKAGCSPATVVEAVERRAVELQGGQPRDDIAVLALAVPASGAA
jgi:serine phosphatase RsbU (regulator of sigma subunit)